MVEIVWQDPPSRRGVRANPYEQIIEVLKQNPGRWALISEDWRASSAPAAFRQSGCQATARANKDKKTWSVYARWQQDKVTARATAGIATDKAAEKAAVHKAIETGTALKPPPPAVKRAKPEEVRPANDMGLNKFLADRRARGA